MTALLDRVKFLGGNGGQPGDTPPLDTTPLPTPDGLLAGLEPDPEPGADTRSAKQARKSAASAQTVKTQTRTGGKFVSKAKVQQDIADELNAYAKMLALTWSMTDEHCAGVLNETSQAITADIAALAARSEWVVEKFQTTSLLSDCFKLLHHAWPLLRAVYVHHIAGRGDEQTEGSDPYGEPVTVASPTVDPNTYGPWRPSNY